MALAPGPTFPLQLMGVSHQVGPRLDPHRPSVAKAASGAAGPVPGKAAGEEYSVKRQPRGEQGRQERIQSEARVRPSPAASEGETETRTPSPRAWGPWQRRFAGWLARSKGRNRGRGDADEHGGGALYLLCTTLPS